MSLTQRFCKFSNSIFKQPVALKDIATVAKNSPFSVYGSNYVEISSKYNGDIDEYNISNTMY